MGYRSGAHKLVFATPHEDIEETITMVEILDSDGVVVCLVLPRDVRNLLSHLNKVH